MSIIDKLFNRTNIKEEEIIPKFTQLSIQDTYDAAYFMTKGARVHKIVKRKLRENKIAKLGYREKWIIHLVNVRLDDIEALRNGTAMVHYDSFRRERLRLKRIARETY